MDHRSSLSSLMSTWVCSWPLHRSQQWRWPDCAAWSLRSDHTSMDSIPQGQRSCLSEVFKRFKWPTPGQAPPIHIVPKPWLMLFPVGAVAWSGKISFLFLMTVQYTTVFMYHTFFIHSSPVGLLGCLHFLAIVTNASRSMTVEVSKEK